MKPGAVGQEESLGRWCFLAVIDCSYPTRRKRSASVSVLRRFKSTLQNLGQTCKETQQLHSAQLVLLNKHTCYRFGILLDYSNNMLSGENTSCHTEHPTDLSSIFDRKKKKKASTPALI